MEAYKLRVPILEFLYRKPGVNLSGFPEQASNNLEDLLRYAFDDLQRSEVQLCRHVTALQTQNKELKAYASTVAHDLKDPLCALLLTSSLITNTPDLTQAQLKKYLEQITSTVQHMLKGVRC